MASHEKKGLLLLNLGTPDHYDPKSVGVYLKEFLKSKKESHLTKLIDKHKGDSKTLFKIFDTSINGEKTTPFPHGKSDIILASDFSKYFSEKIVYDIILSFCFYNIDDIPMQTN